MNKKIKTEKELFLEKTFKLIENFVFSINNKSSRKIIT